MYEIVYLCFIFYLYLTGRQYYELAFPCFQFSLYKKKQIGRQKKKIPSE